MFGIGWMEISMIMTVFTMVMVWIIVIITVVNRRGRDAARQPVLAEPPPHRRSSLSTHLFIAVLLIIGLTLIAPLAWILFGNAGMPAVKLATIGILAAVAYAVVVVAMLVSSQPAQARSGQPNVSGYNDDASMHASVVARITQRFCPQCRAPLAADAPEGLCPACLMAGGLASSPSYSPGNGLAVTTPRSGSQPLTAGEWGDLAGRFPQLEILELLGRGGMGAVYKARQKNLDRLVALKVIPPEAAKDPTFAERFAREARALARLNHPNIVTVYDFGQSGDVYYLLMEYVDGVNLRHAQQASRLSPSEALAIVPQICDALQYAHDQGVVHRDIKPENVLLDRSGRVKIADFGLAKILGKGPADFTLTGTQQVMGTPRYMAPEQIERPTAVDHRADIYSLGVVLYEMLTGELPIGRFQPPSQKVQLDVRVDEVVLRALEKEPDRRYQRASEVKTELASAAVWTARATAPLWQTPAPATKAMAVDADHADRELALRRVRAPAAALMVVGMIGLIALAAFYIFVAMSLVTQPNYQGAPAAFGMTLMGVVVAIPYFCMAAGGWYMGKLQQFGVAAFGSILAILPCSPAWLVTLPFGAWALIVLLDPKVRAAFDAAGRGVPPRERNQDAGRERGSRLMFGAGCGLAAITTALAIPVIAILIYLALPAVQNVRESARRAQSTNNLKQIGLALHNYYDVYQSFPPAVVDGPDGQPLYSGRVLLLPFLEQQALYDSLDLTQSWDSDRNRPLTQMPLAVFTDPSDLPSASPSRTNYLFVTGQGTMFEAGKSTQFPEITDGSSNTMAMIEVRGGNANWAEPNDADLSHPQALPPGNHPGGNLVLFGDGAVDWVAGTTPPLEVRARATIGGGEGLGIRNSPRPQPAIPALPGAPPSAGAKPMPEP